MLLCLVSTSTGATGPEGDAVAVVSQSDRLRTDNQKVERPAESARAATLVKGWVTGFF